MCCFVSLSLNLLYTQYYYDIEYTNIDKKE